jgi:6,7-dimethyl-8-ribityllumazine synthase
VSVRIYEGVARGEDRRVAIVAARYNEGITMKLVDGALAGLANHGMKEDRVEVAWVPGAFEIPLVAERFARTGRYDAVICLGAVIRGDTAHFELVANQAAHGIADVSRSTGVPLIFEVLAAETLEQAEARAGGSHGNKGWEAAEAALRMAGLMEQLPDHDDGKEGRG